MTQPDGPTTPRADRSPVVDAPVTAVGAVELGASGLEATPQPVKLSKLYISGFLLATFCLYIAWIAPLSYSLAVKIEAVDAAGKNSALALAVGIPGIIVLVTGPIFGVLSDRTRSRFGRRRPWLVFGALLAFVGSAATGLAPNVGLVIAAWAVAYIGFTAAGGMLLTHLSDRLPEEQRGRVAGFGGALTQIAPILGVALAGALVHAPVAMFLVPGVVAAVGVLVFAFGMRDEQVRSPEPVDVKKILHGFWFSPRRHPNFGWVWLSRALMFLALSFMQVYAVYLLSERLQLSAAGIAGLVSTAGLGGIVTAVLGAIGCGWLSDRLGKRKPFLLASAVLLGAALVLTGSVQSIPQYLVGALLGSFAIGVYGAVDQATALDVLPVGEGQNGRFMGLYNLANQIPQAIGPFVAGVVVSLAGGEYGMVYFVAAAIAVLGGIAVLPLRLVRSERTEAIRTAKA